MDNQKITLNFLSVDNSDWIIDCYRKINNDPSQRKEYDLNIKLYHFPDENKYYNIGFSDFEGASEYSYHFNDNKFLTINYLFMKVCENCEFHKIEYIKNERYEKNIEIIVNKSDIGCEIIKIIPSYVNAIKKYGYLLNFCFRVSQDHPFDIEVQKRSLSLDVNLNENKSYYIDKYNKIQLFLDKYFDTLFVFGNELKIEHHFQAIASTRLNTKKYEFGGNNTDVSQFQGIKKYGPFIALKDDNLPMVCFVYRNNEKNISYKLYNALNGKLYPTFSGMQAMFHYPLGSATVLGVGVENYTKDSFLGVLQEIQEKAKGKKVVPIILVPWNKDTASENQTQLYFYMKNLLLQNKISSQFISINKIVNDNILKWSVSSLGVQLFSKLGGSPWCVIPQTKRCLIIGIGQAYQYNSDKSIKKYYSYSILTDSSGLFKKIQILSDNQNEKEYLNGLLESIKGIINQYEVDYESFVFHTTFRLRKQELLVIKKLLEEEKKEKNNKHFAVLRFDDHHDYMGYDLSQNSLVPYESTKLRISFKDYLIWFEGQQFGNIPIGHRVGPPMKITIDYAKDDDERFISDYLQDAINLSGANWRGFNAKSLPVSLLYANLLCDFIAEFEKYEYPQINIEDITPWFL
jgi:hypothetical protein